MKKIIYVVLTILQFTGILCTQDIAAIAKAKPFKINGSVYGGLYNMAINQANNKLIGFNTGIHVNMSIYENFQIPVSFNYSSNGTQFNTNTLTLKRMGISPSYKWVKFHAGYRSYFINELVLSGKTIVGGGIELSPKYFSLIAFTGKVDDPYSVGNDLYILPNSDIHFYNRKMYGVKIGFGREKNRISLAGVRTKDLPNSASDRLDTIGVRPQDNFVLSLDSRNTFFKIFQLKFLAAASMLTSDSRITDENIDAALEKWANALKYLGPINGTTRVSFSGKASLGVQIQKINIGLKYEQTDPFYSVLGVSFIQNNFKNYLFDMSGSIFKKINFFSSIGLQKINVTGFTGKKQNRTALLVNLSWPMAKNFNLNGNYTNYVQKSTPSLEQVVDTIAFTANNTGGSAGFNYKIGKGKSPHSLNGNISSMTFDLVGIESNISGVKSMNSSLSYRFNQKEKWGYGGGFQFNSNNAIESKKSTRYGVLANVQKAINESINIKFDTGFRINFTDNVRDGHVINAGGSASYTLIKKHKITLSVQYLNRQTKIVSSKNIANIRANYFYAF